MAAPAIEAVFDRITDRVASLTPSIEPGVPFEPVDEGHASVVDEPEPERMFALRFVSLADQSMKNLGVKSPGVADCLATLELELGYEDPVDHRRVASDCEVLRRGLVRPIDWPGMAPIQLVDVAWSTREVPVQGNRSIFVALGTLSVRYRDVL